MKGKGEFDGPAEDDLHYQDGSHLDEPPKGARNDWKRRMRLHLEAHRREALVRQVAPNLLPPVRRRDPIE